MDQRSADPTSLVLAHLAELNGIPDDTWTEGTFDDLVLRLHRLRALIEVAGDAANAVELTLVDSMETDSAISPLVGQVRRVERSSSAWKYKHSSQDLRDDLTSAVAQSIAIDVATGDIDPMKRNVARATMALALEAIPSFSSLNKAGRDRLGLLISDYRDYATNYRIVIEATEEGQ